MVGGKSQSVQASKLISQYLILNEKDDANWALTLTEGY